MNVEPRDEGELLTRNELLTRPFAIPVHVADSTRRARLVLTLKTSITTPAIAVPLPTGPVPSEAFRIRRGRGQRRNRRLKNGQGHPNFYVNGWTPELVAACRAAGIQEVGRVKLALAE